MTSQCGFPLETNGVMSREPRIHSAQRETADGSYGTEHMTVTEGAPPMFSVTTQSSSEYIVNLREPACTYLGFQHQEVMT